VTKPGVQGNSLNELVVFFGGKIDDLPAWSSGCPDECHIHDWYGEDIPSKYQRVLERIGDPGHSRRACPIRDKMGLEINNPLKIDVANSGIAPMPNDPPNIFAVLANRTNRKATLGAYVRFKAGQKCRQRETGIGIHRPRAMITKT